MKRSLRICATMLAVLLLIGGAGGFSSTVSVRAADNGALRTWAGTPIVHHVGGYDTAVRTLHTLVYDFLAPDIGSYASDANFAYTGTPVLKDARLTVPDGKTAAIGSGVFLGDDYALEKGYVSFDLCLKNGAVTLGLRNAKKATVPTNRGVWFRFDNAGFVTVTEKTSGLAVQVPFTTDLSSGAKTITAYEDRSALRLVCGESAILTVEYPDRTHLRVLDGTGRLLGETDKSDVDEAGYFTLYMEALGEGSYIDNVIFTHVSEEKKTAEPQTETRRIDYSTWTATDALGRTTADNGTAGDSNENRYVGLFYFLCWVGAGQHVQDNTKLYLDGGIDGVKEFFASGRGGEAYWAEPYFGYYRNTDSWVYRKHAYMLKAAGVDFIFLDISNEEVFVNGHMTLFDTWLRMRREGIDTPQIVFFCGDSPATFASHIQKLYTTVYSDENWDTYKELFFLWEGKPLIFGNTGSLNATQLRTLNKKFTVRGSWAWVNQNNYWPWLQEYRMSRQNAVKMENGGWGRSADGRLESLSVALGHHATTSKGRSFANGRQPDNRLNDYEFSSIERAGQGLGFSAQFEAAMALIGKKIPAEDPFVLMITGWNEWIAGCFRDTGNFCNGTADYRYVDNFNAEFSRDAEPMRNRDGYGFGDNYYYQMSDYIRRFKGISATPTADHQTTVDIYDLGTWADIKQTYMDSIGDVEHRNSISYDADFRYINGSGRNDFAYAQMSQDEDNLYFLVKCAQDIIVDNGANWMNLYLDTDGDATNGWAGFDFLINRDRDSFAVTVDRISGTDMQYETVGGAYYAVQGQYMTVRLPKQLLGLSGKVAALNFKWADNSVDPAAEGVKDVMGFMDLGDTAPDDRFTFRYLCEEYTTAPERAVTFDTANRTVSLPTAQAVQTGVSYETKLVDRTVNTLFDMERERAGSFIDSTSLAAYFQHGIGTSTSQAQIFKGKSGNFLRLTGYSDVRTWNDVKGSYELSVRLHMVDIGNSGVYIRGEMPGKLSPKNPANYNVNMCFNYFEWDWYSENGGRLFGGSSLAGSGIGIIPMKDGLDIRIKRYAPDGLTVASAAHWFAYPDGYTLEDDTWFTLRCTDDGTTAKIFFNDVEICSILLEKPGVTYASDGTEQEYYGKATLMDPDGTVLLEVENTRLNSSGSQIALTTRSQTMEVDDLSVSYVEHIVEGGHLTSDFAAVMTEQTFAPDDRLLKTLNMGNGFRTDADATGETAGTESDPESAPDTERDAETTAASAAKGCSSATGGVCAVLVLIGAVPVIRCRRKDD